MSDPKTLIDQPARVQVMRRGIEAVADGIAPLIDAYNPYVDGLSDLPRDGRFLLVGNHSRIGVEGVLIPYLVRQEIGIRVRPLTDRAFAAMPWPLPDLLAACGATIGSAENVHELARNNEPIAVFPGGRREVMKFKGEEYTINWGERAGFARLAMENNYPIVPVASVGGDDIYHSFTTRDGLWGKLTEGVTRLISGKSDMGMPLLHGAGVTLLPRPQRIYLKFGQPIPTTRRKGVGQDKWVATVRDQTKDALETGITELLDIRAGDPYRGLNPLEHPKAVQPV
ncbi:lysophospholipid acyltransferase family protein [Mycobacteroides abscessus]